LAGNIEERQFWLRTLRGLRMPRAPQRAALGCVVGIGRPEQAVQRFYFILPVCGGIEIPLEDGGPTVRVVTPETPVARALIGKSVGDEVVLRKSEESPQSILLIV
jgi:transcription elongation GreA/GreB family factor